jgi:hypothetical protein
VSPIPLRIVNGPIRQWHEGTLGSTSLNFSIGVVQVGPTLGTNQTTSMGDNGPKGADVQVTRHKPGDSNTIHQVETADYGYMPNPKQPNPPSTNVSRAVCTCLISRKLDVDWQQSTACLQLYVCRW